MIKAITEAELARDVRTVLDKVQQGSEVIVKREDHRPVAVGQEAAQGNVLPFNDLLIAAAAVEQGCSVLTGNVRHFQMIPGRNVVPC